MSEDSNEETAWSKLGQLKSLAAGAVLWSQEEPAGHGALLLSGLMGVEKVTDRGDRVVFTELAPGSLLGEMSCLDGRPHSATVKALTKSIIRIFTAAEFRAFLLGDSEMMWRLLLRQSERVRRLTDALLRIGTESVSRRLTYWLCEREGPVIAVTHQDLAAELATTRESITKALASLRRGGYLSVSRGRVEILDKLGLAELLANCE